VNILLDTHVLIWLAISPQNLSQPATNLLTDPNNTLFSSLVSIWEMQIKLQIGKLTLNVSLSELIATQQKTNDVRILPIELVHILALDRLPNPHRDPFDRLLIAQAVVTQMPIVSVDTVFDSYPVQRWW
jgi:PIN domain nuclease of toxin-antitoxin system